MTFSPARADSAEDAIGEWESLLEDLLRGLVHAMNNRLTALSAFAELASMDGEDLELDSLRREITRMSAASTLVGLLASRSAPESLEVRLVLDTALDLHAHHPRMRAMSCSIDQPAAVLPVRVPRWALLRVLLLLINLAKREGGRTRASTACIRLTGDDMLVRVHVTASEAASEEAVRLAGLCGATIETIGDEQVLQIMTLPELRRRERAHNSAVMPTPAVGS